MHLLPELASHHAVSIPELLVSRDERQARQHAWLKRHPVPLVSFTVVAPGPIKDSEVTRRIFNHGVTALRALAAKQGWQIQEQAALVSASGPEGMLSIAAPARDLKLATIELEHSHPLGRLWDIDVHAIIMITHDLGVVAGICDKVLVMYAGRTMEYGNARDVFYQPVHPYSIGLLNAVPRLDAEGETMLTIPGNPPNLLRLPKGCPFQPRCPHAMEICSSAPPLEEFTPGRLRACFKPVEELL